jgi:hypothetical protein
MKEKRHYWDRRKELVDASGYRLVHFGDGLK